MSVWPDHAAALGFSLLILVVSEAHIFKSPRTRAVTVPRLRAASHFTWGSWAPEPVSPCGSSGGQRAHCLPSFCSCLALRWHRESTEPQGASPLGPLSGSLLPIHFSSADHVPPMLPVVPLETGPALHMTHGELLGVTGQDFPLCQCLNKGLAFQVFVILSRGDNAGNRRKQ